MISCNLLGGIGNQMFQIATAHAFGLRHGIMSCFNLEGCYTPNQGNTSLNYKDSVFKNLNRENVIFSTLYNEPKFSYQEIPYHENLLLNGYFQSEKYFNDFKNEIITMFHLSGKDKLKIRDFFNWWELDDKPITSVHIRRGDYLKNPDFHPTLLIDYYKEAMKLIGDSYFIFISDDIAWVKENFKGGGIIYSPFNDEILDLTLMSLCNNNIIANSSFSWWGAYLNQNKNKIVITPKNEKWFGPKGPKDTYDIIPNDWIQI